MAERVPISFLAEAHLGSLVGKKKDVVALIEQKTSYARDRILYPDLQNVPLVDDAARDLVKTVTEGKHEAVRDIHKAMALARKNGAVDEEGELRGQLDLLGKVMFSAMRGDVGTGPVNYAVVLGSGSVVDINRNLPSGLRGLGEAIRGNIIDNREIMRVFDSLDRVRKEEGWGLAAPGNDEYLRELIRHRRDLARLEAKIPEGHGDRDQLMMGVAYLSARIDLMEGEKGGGVVDELRALGVELRGLVDLRGVGGRQRASTDTRDPMSRAESTVQIDVASMPNPNQNWESFEDWVIRQARRKTQNPLSFADWWQGNFYPTIVNYGQSVYPTEMGSNLESKISDFVYAVGVVEGVNKVHQNIDQATPRLADFMAPPKMAEALAWDKQKAETLKGDLQIKFFAQKILEMAYSQEGWRVARGMSSVKDDRSWMEFAKELAERAVMTTDVGWKRECEAKRIDTSDQERLILRARIALTFFAVDYSHEWIRWAYVTKKKGVRETATKQEKESAEKVKWLTGDVGDVGKVSWKTNMPYVGVELNDKGKAIEVKGKMGWANALVWRWGDLMTAKGAYNSAIRAKYAFVMDKLALHEGRDGSVLYEPDGMLKKMSDLDPKTIKRLCEVDGAALGSSYGKELDVVDPKTFFDAIMESAANLWGLGNEDGLEYSNKSIENRSSFGEWVAMMVEVKTDAIFAAGGKYVSHFRQIKAALEVRDAQYTPQSKEQEMLLTSLTSGVFGGSHGLVAEIQRTFGVDLHEYKAYEDAYIRLLTDTPDVDLAWKRFAEIKRLLNRNVFWETVDIPWPGKKR